MPYDRWGVTETTASDLTGTAGLTDAQMVRAEDEIREAIGWFPNPAAYSTDTDANGAPVDVRAWTMGRAISWQAAHRAARAAEASDGTTDGKTSEAIADYSYSKPEALAMIPPPARRLVAPRAAELLVRGGWFARARTGSAGGTRVGSPHDWQRA